MVTVVLPAFCREQTTFEPHEYDISGSIFNGSTDSVKISFVKG